MPTAEFKLEEKLLIADIKTISILFDYENGADLVALYFFYYKTAKLQKTNQIWATRDFCLRGLHWGPQRFLAAKKILEELGLIEIVKGKKIDDKWYVKIGYVKSKTYQNTPVQSGAKTYRNEDVSKQTPNALEQKKRLNALTPSTPKGVSPPQKYSRLDDLTQEDFEQIANRYQVPVSFVLSKFDDMVLWAEERPGNSRLKGRNWRSTLMHWVKRDAFEIKTKPRRGGVIDATHL